MAANISIYVCLFGSIQGFILILALLRIAKKNSGDFRWLIAFLLIISVTLAGRIMYLFPEAIDSRIPVLTDIVLFLYGPLFYFFMKGVFGEMSVTKKTSLHFLPAFLHLLASIPLLLLSPTEFTSFADNYGLYNYYIIIMMFGMIHNIIYWVLSDNYLRNKKREHSGSNVSFDARYVYFVQWMYGSVLVTFLVSIVIYFFSFSISSVLYQMTWIWASWITYGVTYFVIMQPETFGDYLIRVKNQVVRSQREQSQMEKLAVLLKDKLENQKIYLNPEISLIALAKILDTNNVLLSKTINQEFDISFYDLINKYRVEEFISLAQDESNNHFTYFALAIRAGFNSKTSFNKYFKKHTGLTPKEYFRKLSVA